MYLFNQNLYPLFKEDLIIKSKSKNVKGHHKKKGKACMGWNNGHVRLAHGKKTQVHLIFFLKGRPPQFVSTLKG